MVSRGAVLAAALRLVGVAGALVPGARREEWEREWRAELWHLHHSRREPSARDDAAFLLRAAGSLLDALQLRAGDAQEWREGAAAVVARWSEHSPPVAVGLLLLSVGIAVDTLLIAMGRAALAFPLSPWHEIGRASCRERV